MTRSLVVTTWFPDAQNPSRTPFCLAHVHALQNARVDVEVVHVQLGSTTGPAQEVYEGVPVTRVALHPARPRTWWAATAAIRRRLATADVLHTMAFSSVLVATAPWLLRRRPWVHTEHWNGVTSPRSVGRLWWSLSAMRHVLRLPHVVTGVTAELAREMSRFARRDAVRVVPCVVPTPARIAPFPSQPPLRLVGVGLVIERKNPLLAVETVSVLRQEGVDVRYRWIGDGPLIADVNRRVAELGLGEHITFTGPVEPSRVQEEIQTAHLFFVPSAQENFFTALAESIAAGRPVVAPRSGGFVDYCRGDNAELVDGWDPRALAEAIVRARDRFRGADPDHVSSTVGTVFSSEQVGRQLVALYDEVRRQGRG